MALYGPLWIPMALNGPLWLPMSMYNSLWLHMTTSYLLAYLELHMDSDGSLWLSMDPFSHKWPSRHGILRERASVARGRFVPDCGRICGIHETQYVEANIFNGFRKK